MNLQVQLAAFVSYLWKITNTSANSLGSQRFLCVCEASILPCVEETWEWSGIIDGKEYQEFIFNGVSSPLSLSVLMSAPSLGFASGPHQE